MTVSREMNIRVIFFGSIYDRNGAAKVVRSFAENGQLFLEYCGHHVVVFDKSEAKSIAEKASTEKECETKSSLSLFKLLKRRVKSFLGKAVMERYAKSYLGTKRYIEKNLWIERGRGIIDSYYSAGLNDDAYIFHDIFACWAYVDHCQRNGLELKKFLLVLHVGEELLKSVLIKYPIIKGTRYLKTMNRRAETCYELAQRIVFVSERSATTFKANYPIYADKVRFVYNGIDEMPSPNPCFDGKIRMVVVGTVCKRRNQIVMLDCLELIRKHHDATITFIGGGPALEECKQRAKDLNLEQWVTFLGSIDGVADELEKCNLFVMSSLDEGLPIAAIEAMRAKLPLVLTNVGGCRELIEDNGYLVQPNIDEIADAVVDFGRDIEKQKKMSEASFRLFEEKFTLDAMIRGYSEIIEEVFSWFVNRTKLFSSDYEY